ncbi:carboxylating nicotinate-nucleotide diphosphorylase [Georgenia sp. Z1344]|uniref:carboxylating nicotinate-nucleotide diphosphorylase n=1 Tax=Georgenia sp. Z1344 TaxID=3416706 RepID=UPI003CF8615C
MRHLPTVLIEPLVRDALREDLGRAGDVTTDWVVPADREATAELVARDPGVVAGTDLVVLAFSLLDPRVTVDVERPDGTAVAPGDRVATVSGPARALLTAERVALNFLGHLSGVATATAQIAGAISGTGTRVCCTRKTTPGLRTVEKHAVVAGGGVNHRFGLDDAVLIKDNHVALAGGVGAAVARVREAAGHLVPIEVEVDTLDQLRELLATPVDAVLLDNMTPDQLAEAVELVDGRMVTEASGRLTAETAPAVAASGVDLVSAGWLTHSAPVLDIGLDLLIP